MLKTTLPGWPGLLLGILSIPAPAMAQKNSESPMLIQPAALEKQLKETDLRILDVRSKEDYAKGHIPGAVWVDIKPWQALVKTKGGFTNKKVWGEKIGSLGIGLKTTVVVYGDRLSNTARLWWLLTYAGIRDARILDGGWAAWTEGKRPQEKIAIKVEAISFEPQFQTDRLMEIEELKEKAKSKKVQVVDTRSEDEFTGKEVRGKRGGHIPGATHLEWKELLRKDGRFKSKDQLKALFKSRGMVPDKPLVCY